MSDLGGVHKYDLTPDVTHLIVGDYDTPKYRHVARERPDIRAMDATWVDAVSALWKDDEPIDFSKLEREHQLRPLEMKGSLPQTRDTQEPARQSLLICLTGFGYQRDEIAEKITANGGRHTDDLTRRCTHLIVNKPEGKKFTAAKSWNIRTVTLSWLDQSVERGMILEEERFDPLLPAEEQGVGAWVKRDFRRPSLGKRARSSTSAAAEDGTRKLRKTASMKLNSQRNNLWGDILGRSDSREYSFVGDNGQEEPTQPLPKADNDESKTAPKPRPIPQPEREGIFADCIFYIHGFSQTRTNKLTQTITGLGALTASTLAEAASGVVTYRFLIVPQMSQPDEHPQIPDDSTVHIVTEFYVEKCMHNRRFFPPGDHHVLGRPFPLFPIPGFGNLTICTAAFTGIELSHVSRSVEQLGARYQEQFRRETSVLVARSLDSIRKEKLRAALAWGVPVVSADWLWECISTGYNVPMDDFVFPEIRDRLSKRAVTPSVASEPSLPRRPSTGPASAPAVSEAPVAKKPAAPGIDPTAFEGDEKQAPAGPSKRLPIPQDDSSISADFNTARTHNPTTAASTSALPLTELSPSGVNKSPSPPKAAPPERTTTPPAEAPASAPAAPSAADKQQEEEEARRRRRDAAKAAERQALTTKLTSLLDASAEGTAPLPEDVANNSSSGPRPRRRQILGRAISNASTGSNTTSDVARPLPDGEGDAEGRQRQQSMDLELQGEEQPPPATQIGYLDPEAQNRKAALMDRMMGGSGDVGKAAKRSASIGGGRAMRPR